MDAQVLDLALETAAAMSQIARAVAREGSQQVSLNRTQLRAHAERISASKCRWRLREKLWGARLPYDRPAIVYGGPGDGRPCAACDKATSHRQLVMAIPVANPTMLAYLHADCFELWDVLRCLTPRVRPGPELRRASPADEQHEA